MRDTELLKLFGIPTRTLADWKKRPTTDWRKKLYTYLSLKTIEEITPEMDRIEKILKLLEKK